MSNYPQHRITVLLGGDTGERTVSLHSGMAVAAAVLRLGHRVRLLDPATGRSDEVTSDADLARLSPVYEALSPIPGQPLASLARLDVASTDLVAIVLHGGSGEGGRVQAVLDLAGIPYTGCGAGASHLAMDKVVAKKLLRADGIPVAEELLWKQDGSATTIPAPPDIASLGGYPVVVKPIAGGSTLGLTIVQDPSQWSEAWRTAGDEIDPERGLLVERYIPGHELTVGILEGRVLPVVEIVPKTGFYDYRRKYTKGETEYVVPARIRPEWAERIQDWALRAFRLLGCRDLGRVDFRMTAEGESACLEVNTVPGMTATSLLPMAAAAVGIGFDDLVGILCERAWAPAGDHAGVDGRWDGRG